jgi:hypothetical protein
VQRSHMRKLSGVRKVGFAAWLVALTLPTKVFAAHKATPCGRLFVERTYASDLLWDPKTNTRTVTAERIPQIPTPVIYPVPLLPTPLGPVVSPDGTLSVGPGGVVSTLTSELVYRFPSELNRTGNFGFTNGPAPYTRALLFLDDGHILVWMSGNAQYGTWSLADAKITDLTDVTRNTFFVGTRELVTLNGKRYIVAQTFDSDFLLVDVLDGTTSPVFDDGEKNAQISVVGNRIFGATSTAPFALRERTSEGIRVIAPLAFGADGKFKGEYNEETNRILVRSGKHRQIVNYETGEVTRQIESPLTNPKMVGLLRSGVIEATTDKLAFLNSNNRWRTLTFRIGPYSHGVSCKSR